MMGPDWSMLFEGLPTTHPMCRCSPVPREGNEMAARSPQLRQVLESMVPLDEIGIAAAPAEVWLRVEEMILFGWFHAAKASVIQVDGDEEVTIRSGSGWLRLAHIEPMHARDVPVGRMFRLALLERRRDAH